METYNIKQFSFIKGDDEYNNMKIKGIFKVISHYEKEGWTFKEITASYNPCGILNIFIHFYKEEK